MESLDSRRYVSSLASHSPLHHLPTTLTSSSRDEEEVEVFSKPPLSINRQQKASYGVGVSIGAGREQDLLKQQQHTNTMPVCSTVEVGGVSSPTVAASRVGGGGDSFPTHTTSPISALKASSLTLVDKSSSLGLCLQEELNPNCLKGFDVCARGAEGKGAFLSDSINFTTRELMEREGNSYEDGGRDEIQVSNLEDGKIMKPCVRWRIGREEGEEDQHMEEADEVHRKSYHLQPVRSEAQPQRDCKRSSNFEGYNTASEAELAVFKEERRGEESDSLNGCTCTPVSAAGRGAKDGTQSERRSQADVTHIAYQETPILSLKAQVLGAVAPKSEGATIGANAEGGERTHYIAIQAESSRTHTESSISMAALPSSVLPAVEHDGTNKTRGRESHYDEVEISSAHRSTATSSTEEHTPFILESSAHHTSSPYVARLASLPNPIRSDSAASRAADSELNALTANTKSMKHEKEQVFSHINDSPSVCKSLASSLKFSSVNADNIHASILSLAQSLLQGVKYVVWLNKADLKGLRQLPYNGVCKCWSVFSGEGVDLLYDAMDILPSLSSELFEASKEKQGDPFFLIPIYTFDGLTSKKKYLMREASRAPIKADSLLKCVSEHMLLKEGQESLQSSEKVEAMKLEEEELIRQLMSSSTLSKDEKTMSSSDMDDVYTKETAESQNQTDSLPADAVEFQPSDQSESIQTHTQTLEPAVPSHAQELTEARHSPEAPLSSLDSVKEGISAAFSEDQEAAHTARTILPADEVSQAAKSSSSALTSSSSTSSALACSSSPSSSALQSSQPSQSTALRVRGVRFTRQSIINEERLSSQPSSQPVASTYTFYRLCQPRFDLKTAAASAYTIEFTLKGVSLPLYKPCSSRSERKRLLKLYRKEKLAHKLEEGGEFKAKRVKTFSASPESLAGIPAKTGRKPAKSRNSQGCPRWEYVTEEEIDTQAFDEELGIPSVLAEECYVLGKRKAPKSLRCNPSIANHRFRAALSQSFHFTFGELTELSASVFYATRNGEGEASTQEANEPQKVEEIDSTEDAEKTRESEGSGRGAESSEGGEGEKLLVAEVAGGDRTAVGGEGEKLLVAEVAGGDRTAAVVSEEAQKGVCSSIGAEESYDTRKAAEGRSTEAKHIVALKPGDIVQIYFPNEFSLCFEMDDVPVYDEEMLTRVLKKAIELCEVGTPDLTLMNVCQFSKIIFWNIVRLSDGNIEDTLASFIPSSYCRTRRFKSLKPDDGMISRREKLLHIEELRRKELDQRFEDLKEQLELNARIKRQRRKDIQDELETKGGKKYRHPPLQDRDSAAIIKSVLDESGVCRRPMSSLTESQRRCIYQEYLRRGFIAPITVQMIPDKGRGVFAADLIKKDDFIVEYKGELITEKEGRERDIKYNRARTQKGSFMFYFKHDSRNFSIDATDELASLGPGRLINHSRRSPNLVARAISVDDEARLFFCAKTDIALNKELVVDYGERDSQAILENPWLND